MNDETLKKVDENNVEVSTVVKKVLSIDVLVKQRDYFARQVQYYDAKITEAKALGVKEKKDIVIDAPSTPVDSTPIDTPIVSDPI